PNTGLLKDIVSKDPSGAVLVDGRMMSSSPGIFAAGDCTSKILHQVVTACGDGAVAAYAAGQYVDELKGVAYK
ncbi:MAG: FAD-dependent oxidoreductase, partial [Candidatus Omnitrophica bacterium]|nr:FAD-dependent oxidoreductase [Candidatus Omnitrophota bacterium]